MALPRFISLVDFGVLAVVAVAIFLPAREMYAENAFKGDEFPIALAEARTIARPGDGKAIEDFIRVLSEAGMKDWAVEASGRLSERAKDSPTRWRALIATSAAYMEKLDAKTALEYANMALAACQQARAADAGVCPSWEEVRMQIYQQHLDAGVKSGIDPRIDPVGFRNAGQNTLRHIRLGPANPPPPPPAPGSNSPSGSGTGSAP
jgi:hypothetical protein